MLPRISFARIVAAVGAAMITCLPAMAHGPVILKPTPINFALLRKPLIYNLQQQAQLKQQFQANQLKKKSMGL
jgi:hypothetical protein